MILDESRLILKTDKWIQLSNKNEAEEIKYQHLNDDGGPTIRQEILSILPEIKSEDDVFLFVRLLGFYWELRLWNTVRNISNKYSNVEDFENNYFVEETLFEEAHRWKGFAEDISSRAFLYKENSFWGGSEAADFNIYIDKTITDIFHLLNQTELPEFHDRNIGKSAIVKISELKKLPSQKLEEKFEPRDYFSR